MENKVVLVTGASKGIGAATIKEFAKNGYNVVINYNNSVKEATDLEEYILDKYDVSVLKIKCDVSSEYEVDDMVNQIIDTFGHIDILVNNAGIAIDDEYMDHSVPNFKKVIDTNLIGTYCVSKYVSKYMLAQKSGVIINISSNNGIDCYSPMSLDYDASKAGVISLTHNLAVALAPYIRVNAIAPGWTKTSSVMEMMPEYLEFEKKKILLDRFAEPEEIADVIYFLASDKAKYINNEVIRVDGGQRC